MRGWPADIVGAVVKALGLRHTRPPTVAGQWGSTVLSASDVSLVRHYLVRTWPQPTWNGQSRVARRSVSWTVRFTGVWPARSAVCSR
ncbi:hypothetical protein SAMN04488564_12260 [Lentzea waywayandensis]|uniref:Uncharacterized protein n=1 Tax=Lentzea waywayandensis TaxID=84724 RepID=A0A1I6FIU5_9PSEU|nr:hypothetical protein SAMN04488564_12260 [Lentzea waywayandensis]